MPTPLPATSLIICSRDRPSLLLATVESVLAGQEVPAEILVVDQSATPHPVLSHWPARPGCELRYLWSQSVGVSRGRNEGIAAARFDILVIIDDDIFVAPNWFDVLVRALCNAGPRAAVTGRVLPTAPEVPGGFVWAVVMSQASAVYQGRIFTEVLVSCNMALFRSALAEVGGFDERLGPGTPLHTAEDNDLGFRLLEAGYCILYVPEAVTYHRAWRPWREYLSMRWRYGVGKGGYYAKYFSLKDRYMLQRMAYDIGHRIWGLPIRLLRNPTLVYGDPAYIFGIFIGLTRWARTQHGAQA
jgi:GT2 family glycosyltransferase